MRTLLHALTNKAPVSATPKRALRPRPITRIWRLLPVALAFAFALTLVAQVNHPTASAQTPPPAALEKLDPYLQLLFGNSTLRTGAARLPQLAIAENPMSNDARQRLDALGEVFATDAYAPIPTVRVLIEGTVSLGNLRTLNARPTVQVGSITGAIIPISSLAALSNLSTVEWIEASRIQTATNDLARIDSGAGLARDPLPGYDGAGVVVGIIDTGIDFTHEDFLRPDGTTRIKALLDVTDPGPHSSGGTVFSEADINDELASPGSTVPETDTHGHGTHVAGSAAGDGSAANGASAPAGTYAGIAPASDLVIVKAGDGNFPDDAVLAAIAFVRDTADGLGQPWVVNMSLGGHYGAHDGTSLYEQAIDGFIGPSDDGAAIVVAAGNSGDDNIHARGTVVASSPASPVTTEVTTTVPPGASTIFYDIWYEGSDELRFGWRAPGNASVWSASDGWYPVGFKFTDCFTVSSGINCVTVSHFPDNPQNGDKRIVVEIRSTGVQLLPGSWTFEFEGNVVVDGTFDAWSLRGYTPFTAHVNDNYRLGIPGTATEVITVGAYGTNPATGQAVGPATTFSSPGPTRDLRQKPEIIAPGAAIFSSFSSDAPGDFGIVAPGGLHVGIHGSSMATPVVTGAIALLLQVDPTLDAIEIRDLLIATAREDAYTGGAGSGWDPKTGYGKLDIYAALAELLQTDISTSTVSAGDALVAADGVASTTVTVTLTDSSGNPVLGHYVILGEDGGIADVTPDELGVTDAAGVATYTVTSSTAGLSTLAAFDVIDGVLITDTAEITFASLATDPDNSTVDATDPSVVANGIASTTVTVTLLDGLNDPVPGHNVILAQDGTSTISSGGTGVTDGSGQISFTVTNPTVETVTYDATDTTQTVAVTDTAEVEFTPIVSDPDNSTVDITDPSVAANGVASTTVTVTLLDSLGVPVPSHDVTLTQGGGSSTIEDGGLGTTDGSGQVSFLVTNTNVELVTYSAEDTTDTVDINDTADVDFIDPVTDADTSTVEAADPTVIADTVDETTITVTLFDSDGVLLAGHNVTLSQDGSSTISDGGLGSTDGSGQVAFTVTSDTVETITYSATDTTNSVGVTQTAQVEFTPLPTDADESAVVVGDATVPADGVSSTTITVTLEDELGAPLAGHNISLDQGVGSSVISGSGVTDGSGQTVFSVTNTTQEIVTYTATDDTDSITITQTAQVEFTEVPSDAGNSTVSAAAPTVLANGVGTTTVTVTLRNLLGNPVGGHTVTLEQASGSASISDGGSLVSDVEGRAEFTVTNPTPELVTFNATDTTNGGPITQTAEVTFIVPTTDAGQSTVTAVDPVVEADGTDTTTVTVTLRDADGAPLVGHDVTLSQGGGSSTIEDSGIGTTNGAGQAVFTVSNATVEDVSYSATDDTDSVAVSQTAKVRFLIADEDASLSSLSTSPGSLSPAFNPNTLDYSASVSNGIESVDVTPTTTQSGSTLTVNGDTATSGAPVNIELEVGGNPVEIIVTAPDDTTTATYTLTVNRAAPSLPPIFIPPPPPPQLRVDVTLTNDDGGTASVEDFTILVDDLTELTSGESAILTFGGHVVSLTGPTAFYSVEFDGTCFEDGTVILLGGLSVCTVDLNDQPIAQVLSEALPDAAALIDESLSLTDDAFERDGTNYVEASSAGSPPEVTVAMPVDAIPGGGTITILVSPANELAIGQNPPPGALLIGGTGYVIQILDGDGNPITNFALPLEISFLLPEGVGTADAYYFDADLGIWLLEPGSTSDGRLVVTPTHLTTFGLFGIGPGGGLLGTPPSRGIWFTTAEGGSVLQLRRALLDNGAAGAFITYQGEWLGYLPGSPDFVNQRFRDFFGAGIPQGQVLLISIGN